MAKKLPKLERKTFFPTDEESALEQADKFMQQNIGNAVGGIYQVTVIRGQGRNKKEFPSPILPYEMLVESYIPSEGIDEEMYSPNEVSYFQEQSITKVIVYYEPK